MSIEPTPHHTAPTSHPPVFDLSIVIPVYNEEQRIARSLDELRTFCDVHAITAEIIVVDDGSTDDTANVLEKIASRHCDVRLIRIAHAGKAQAVLAGFRTATGPVVGFIDADMATPLDTWFACKDALANGAGVVIASREGAGARRLGEPWYRHAMGRAFNFLVRLLLLPGIHDTQCGFKFFTREALDTILPRCRLYREPKSVAVPRVTAFDVELLYIARTHGYRIAIIPITWTYGTHSKVNPITDTLQNLRDVLLVRLNGWRRLYR